MSGEYQPTAAPAPQNVPAGPTYAPSGHSGNDYGGSPQVVQNPALGRLGTPIELPRGGATPQPQQPFAQPGLIPNQEYNPYANQSQGNPSPYAPVPQQNPYGSQQPQSPYAAPPIPVNGYPQQGYTPPGQAAPAQQFQQPVAPQPYAFDPYGHQPGQHQQQPQQPQQQTQPFQQLQPQQQPPIQNQQLTADKLAKQEGGLTPEQVAQIFPDQTSQAVFQGMDTIARGQNIDLLAAFGQAYERRDPTLVNDRYLAQFDPQTVAILKGQFGALVAAGQQRDAQIEQQVYQMAGGEQRWNLAVQAFNTAADPATIDAVVAAVNSGDPNQVRLAVNTILQFTGAQGNLIQRSGQSLTPNGGGQAPQEVMTNEAFRQHLGWLEQAHPVGSPEYNRHYQELVEKRRQAKAMGY
ncbi:scaffolding protein [Escherichia phage smaasur]|uniref:Scaffolding protein n=1 Tax=Escherichia phage smaasur TaxID=2696444 RepID=A0A6B9X5B1_9CAUD|nr:scaffolding protein [Escherichia phage smaasur]